MLRSSGVSRDFMLVGPKRGPIKVCFSTPKLGGTVQGHAPPKEIFEKLALTRAILVHFGQFLAHYVNIIISKLRQELTNL
jgi:hypothetical protein